jgi:molybdopterin/thiamine biosynthesis adenylyltransferase
MMGIKDITIYDDDDVENHNLPNQLYRIQDIGKSKVEAIASICKDFAGVDITTRKEKVSNQQLSGIVISGVDSMKTRKDIWEKAIRLNPFIPIYIDGRMGGQVCRIYAIRPCDPDDIVTYEDSLYQGDKVKELPCTARAIIYTSFMIGSLIANQVRKNIRAESTAREIVFDLQTLSLITRE